MLLRENDRTACTSAKVIQEYFATQGQNWPVHVQNLTGWV